MSTSVGPANPETERCTVCLLPKADHEMPFAQRPLPGSIYPKQTCSYFIGSHTCFVCRRFTGGCCVIGQGI